MAVFGFQLGAGPTPSRAVEKRLAELARLTIHAGRRIVDEEPEISALDLVCRVTAMLEDSPFTNCGTGSELNAQGVVECDACVVSSVGGRRRYAAVGALQDTKNPSLVCRSLIHDQCIQSERANPTFLVGTGARAYATEKGFEVCDVVTERARDSHAYWRKHLGTQSAERVPTENLYLDTVGVFAVDDRGDITCCASSGGVLLKLPGRLGPAAVLGAGCDIAGSRACLCSGFGDDIQVAQLAQHVCTANQDLEEVPDWMRASVNLQRDPYFGVLSVEVDEDVTVEYFHTTESMVVAVSGAKEPDKCSVVVSKCKGGRGGWRVKRR